MAEMSFSGDEMQLVVFKLDKEEYGVSILQVQEIKQLKRVVDITRVPYTPDYIKGVLNLRGSVIPIIDLKKRLRKKPADKYTDATRIIFVHVGDMTVGVIVDAVSEVTAIEKSTIEAPEIVVGAVDAAYLSGVGKSGDRLIILLNVEMIVGLGAELKNQALGTAV